MKIYVDLLQNLQLDYIVATLEYDEVIANQQRVIGRRGTEFDFFRPSSDVEQAGEIVDREQITVLMLEELCEATCPTGTPSSALDRNLRGKPRGSARGSSEQAGTQLGGCDL